MESLFGFRGVVACVFQHTNLVFYLYHQDGSFLFVIGCDVFHPMGKSTVVCLVHVFGKGAGYFKRFTMVGVGAWIFSAVFLEPKWGIAAHGILPDSEP